MKQNTLPIQLRWLQLSFLITAMCLVFIPTLSAQTNGENPNAPYVEFVIKDVTSCEEKTCLEVLDPTDPNLETADREIIFNLIPHNFNFSDYYAVQLTAEFRDMTELSEIWFLEIENVKEENIYTRQVSAKRYDITIYFQDPTPEDLALMSGNSGIPIVTKRMANTKTVGKRGYSSREFVDAAYVEDQECYKIRATNQICSIITSTKSISIPVQESFFGSCKNGEDEQPIEPDQETSIENIEEEIILKDPVSRIYPNPSNRLMFLELNQVTRTEVSLMDITGKEVVRTSEYTDLVKLPVDHLAPGLYIINLYAFDSNYKYKVMVSE